MMDPSAIRPPGRITVGRFDPRERSGRIVAPIDGAITSRAPAPQLLHDDPQHSRKDAKDEPPLAETEPGPADVEASATTHAPPAAPLPFIASADVLLMVAERDAHAAPPLAGAYRVVSPDDDVRPLTDIEI